MNMASLAPSRTEGIGRRVKILVVWLVALLGLLTSNQLLTSAGVGILPVLVALLWRPDEPPSCSSSS